MSAEEDKAKAQKTEAVCSAALGESIQQGVEAAAEGAAMAAEETAATVADAVLDIIIVLQEIAQKLNKVATGMGKPRDPKQFNPDDVTKALEKPLNSIMSPLDSLGIKIPGLDMISELLSKLLSAPPPPTEESGSFDPSDLLPSLTPDLKDDLIAMKDAILIISMQLPLALIRALWDVVKAIVGILKSLPVIGDVGGPIPTAPLTAIPDILDNVWILVQSMAAAVYGVAENKISGALALFQSGAVPGSSSTPSTPTIFGKCAEHTEEQPPETT